MPAVAWSYSVIQSFETCAFRHYVTKVAKTVTEGETDAMRHGKRVHKMFENRVKDGTPFDKGTPELYEKIAARIVEHGRGGRILTEQQMALDESYRPTKWFGKGANAPWVRAITDVSIFKGSKAAVFDYKTGNRDPESAQLKLSAAVIFAVHPEVNEIRNGFIWLKEGGSIDSETYYRTDAPSIWQEFIPRVRRLEIAHEKNEWPKKPSGLCKKWCPVPHTLCEHRGV